MEVQADIKALRGEKVERERKRSNRKKNK